jgi:tRNA G18 (ribose-2'-O)-methylase SpoU
MSSTYYNLSEDWGWYVDIESSNTVYQIKTDFVKNQNKKFNQHYNKLDTIIEDEYDYYLSNQKNLDDITMTSNPEKIIDNNKEYYLSKNLLNVGSTTIITAILTYVIFFIL